MKKKKIQVAVIGDIEPKSIPIKKVWKGTKGMKRLANKIKFNREKREQDKAKQLKKIKFWSYLAIIVSAIIFAFILVNSYIKWSRNNTIIFQAPLSIKTQKMIEVVSLAELNRRQEEIALKEELSKIVVGIIFENKTLDDVRNKLSPINSNEFFEFIWNAETTKGKNGDIGLSGYCRSIGMWNEIGYGGATGKMCFKDEQEARYMIDWYVYKNGQGLTMSQLLCYYNEGNERDDNGKSLGHPRKTCPYSEGRFGEAN